MVVNMESKMKQFIAKYGHGIPLLVYAVIYLAWFRYLELNVTKHFQVIHMTVDDYIPFCEVFVIPYFLWFAYVSLVVLFLFFKDKTEYCKTCIFLFTGMTVFLIISTIMPNGHHLRPLVLPRDNIFAEMVAALYSADTPTNLWPSIHVYNSLGAHLAITKSKTLGRRKGIRIASLLLSSSIIASTMLIKQHSVFDVLTAFLMAGVMYAVVYRYDLVAVMQTIYTKNRPRPQIG